jgi:hypothetical protein
MREEISENESRETIKSRPKPTLGIFKPAHPLSNDLARFQLLENETRYDQQFLEADA